MSLSGLIVGLGNPGEAYARTRHNFGFLVADAVREALEGHRVPGGSCSGLRKGKDAHVWTLHLDDARWLLVKPMTYMNLSGRPVARLVREQGLQPEQVLVLHDELDLELGKIRFKVGGGLAGHNGLKSVAACLSSREFRRMRLGIDRPPAGGDVSGYVLGRFSKGEAPHVRECIDVAAAGVLRYMEAGLEKAMQELHSA
jgi:PTH1 family peptidyl-tRNA hydrolase